MFDTTTIQDEIYGLVGAEQTNNPDYPQLAVSLLTSRSGKRLQRVHSLVNIENIDQCSKNYDKYNYATWSVSTEYSLGNQVRYSNGTAYEYTNATPTTGNLPTDATYWTEINLISDYLIKTQKQAYDDVLSDMVTEKKLNHSGKAIWENTLLFDGPGNYQDKIVNTGAFVGLRLRLKNHRSLKAVINKIGTQLSQVVDFDLYVFHSSQNVAIATIPANHTRANDFIWHAPTSELALKFWSDSYDVGGDFYVGYFQDDLGNSQAINKSYDWSGAPCGPCNARDAYMYNNWSNYVEIDPIIVSANALNGNYLFDIDKVGFVYNQNFGLNLNLTPKCDLTDFIVQEEITLAIPAYYKWGLIILNDIAFNTRNNAIAKQTRDLAMYEISEKRQDNIAWKYRNALKAVSYDFSELGDACLPCNDKYGVLWSKV